MAWRKRVILLSLVLANLVEQPTLEIRLAQGRLKGRVSADGTVLEYLAIPYATANHTNRFREPFPAPSWEGVLNAVEEHHRCPQLLAGKITIGQEDCLKINIYVPSTETHKTPLPVMVFIHGGGYFENSAAPSIYGPNYFVRHGVILVTFNYRLGALGFLCLGIDGAPGNAGLRDQMAALRWIKSNIKAFGGDPDNITLFGESAGAASISFLKLNPFAEDLFKRTILQSGSSLGAWSVQRDPVATASRFAKAMGFVSSNNSELLTIYKEATIQQLVATDVPKPNDSIITSRLLFVPCIERNISGITKVINEDPFETLFSGRYVKVPTISGFNDKEGIFLVGKENANTLEEKNKSTSLPSNLEFNSDGERIEAFKRVRRLYFGDKGISAETKLKLADLYSDVFFIMPSIFEADIVANTSSGPHYNYFFKYSGYRNLVKYISGFFKESGASHADDLFYMFKAKLYPFIFGKDQIVIDRVTKLWTNFAKYGNPTPTTSELLPLVWSPSAPGDLKFLVIDETLSMGPVPNTQRTTFWKYMYAKYRRRY